MGGAVMFVMTLATISTWLVQYFVLTPLNIGFLQTITFILIIAALVQMVEIILKKVSPPLYAALGVFLPLITTNCAVMGVCLINVKEEYSFVQALIASFSYAVGFGLALILFAVKVEPVPPSFNHTRTIRPLCKPPGSVP
jgi:electron transport complex protein RnfA